MTSNTRLEKGDAVWHRGLAWAGRHIKRSVRDARCAMRDALCSLLGCGGSKFTRERFKLSESGFVTLKALTKRFDLKHKHLEKLRTKFAAIDGTVEFFEEKSMVEREGFISLKEFFIHFELDGDPFSKRVFEVMDHDESGKVDFCEFVMSLYSYCTRDWHGLVDFAFDIVDKSHDDALSFAELRELIETVYGHELDETCEQVLAKIDKNHDDQLSRAEFHCQSRKFPVLLFPAFHIRDLLQKRVMGHRWWEKQCHRLRHDKKVKIGPNETVLGVMQMLQDGAADLRAAEKEARKKAAKEEAEAQAKEEEAKEEETVKGAGGDGSAADAGADAADDGGAGGNASVASALADVRKTPVSKHRGGAKLAQPVDGQIVTKKNHRGPGATDADGVWHEQATAESAHRDLLASAPTDGESDGHKHHKHNTPGKGAAVRRNKYETNTTRERMHTERADVTKAGVAADAHREHQKDVQGRRFSSRMEGYDEREALAAAKKNQRLKGERADQAHERRHTKRLAHARMQSVKNLLLVGKGHDYAADPHCNEHGVPHSHHHKKWRAEQGLADEREEAEGGISNFIGSVFGSNAKKKKKKKKKTRGGASVVPGQLDEEGIPREASQETRHDPLAMAAKSAAGGN
jgi:Ca2+-binding EF-hand superfamily protein